MTLVIVLSASATFTLVFYALDMRLRPPVDHDVRLILPPPRLPSFPSGHAVLAFGLTALMAIRLKRRVWDLALLFGAAAIGYSRVYLGHHYPSDVLAGVLMGSAIGIVCCGLVYLDGEPLA